MVFKGNGNQLIDSELNMDEPDMEAGDWYILKYLDAEGGSVDAVARQNEDGEIMVKAKASANMCINFSNELVDEWVRKEFDGQGMD
jgi:hypothetical protein